MSTQSLSYTPSFITDYIPYADSFFARFVYADGITPSSNEGAISIAVLNSQTISNANLINATYFKKEIQYLNACEVKFTNASVFNAGYLLKGCVTSLIKAANIQFIEEGTAASGDIKFSANPINGTTLTLGLTTGYTYTTYRFVNTLIQPFDVKIGATAADTLDNLRRAINIAGVVGTNYYFGTSSNPVFSASITGTVLTYTDKIKCKRIDPYFISASDYTYIVIRTPIGGTDGALLLQIPSTSSFVDFKTMYYNDIYSSNYSFGKKETYSSTESLFIPLLGQSVSVSPVFWSDDVNLNGFFDPAVVIEFGQVTDESGEWAVNHYYLPSGSDQYSIIQPSNAIATSPPDSVANYFSQPVDNVKISLDLGLQISMCYFFAATVYY